MKDSKLYKLIRPIVKLFTNICFRPTYIGLENIPKKGPIVLAGNHTNNFDCLLLISSTKRSIHFLAKDELWKFPKSIIFSHLGLIPVNRREKDKEALKASIEYLKNNEIIGIFPEGTISKTKDLLPFKFGAVKMAIETNTKIVPFAISGKYKLFSKNIKIQYGKPININKDDIEKQNEILREKVIEIKKEK